MKRLIIFGLLLSSVTAVFAIDRNDTGQYLELQAIDTANNTPKTGDAGNITAYYSIDGGSVTALADTSATELSATNAPGVYRFDLSQAETNGKNIVYSGKSATGNVSIINRTVTTIPKNLSSIVPTSTDVTTPITFSVVATPYAGSATGINVTTAGANTTGSNLLLAAVNAVQNATAPTLSDNYGNIWALWDTITNGTREQRVYLCVNPRVGSGHTFTVTSAGLSPSVFVIAMSNARLADYDDGHDNNTATGTTIQAGSVTPTENNCIVVHTLLAAVGSSPTIDESYTYNSFSSNASGNHIGGGLGYKIQTTAGATNPTWTNGGSATLCAGVYGFKPALAATNTLSIDQFENYRVCQREAGGTSKKVVFTGKYHGTAPSSIEIKVYKLGTLQLLQPAQKLSGLSCASGIWTGTATINQGGWLEFIATSKDANDATIATSIGTDTKFGVGINVLVIGQSNGYKYFQDYALGAAADDLTSQFVAGVWGETDGDGAIALADAVSAETGLPVGVWNYAVSGVGLVYDAGAGYWLDETPGEPWPLCQAGIAAAGGDFEYVVWQGCEADGDNASFDADTLKAGFDTLYSRLQEEINRTADTLPFVICVPGPLNDSLTTDSRWSAVRTAVIEWGEETDGALLVSTLNDGVLVDDYHFGGVTYDFAGRRVAQTILDDLGEATYEARGPQVFKAWRFSGSPIMYVQLADVAAAGIAEVDGTTDGGSLTGFTISDDAWSTTETISSTAIDGNVVKLTLSATPTDGATVVGRFCYGKTPTITNLPYRNSNPQGSTRGVPLQPGSFSVELRTAYSPATQVVSVAAVDKDWPRNIGYTRKTTDGAVAAARATSNITLLAETETSATYSTFVSQATGGVVWDNGTAANASQIDGLLATTNGAATVATQLARLDAAVSTVTSGMTVSAFLTSKGHSWKFDNANQVTSPNRINEASGFNDLLVEMDFSGVLNGNASISSISAVTVTDITGTEPTVVSSAKRADQRAVMIVMDGASATVATQTVNVTIVTTDGQTLTRKGYLVVQ